MAVSVEQNVHALRHWAIVRRDAQIAAEEESRKATVMFMHEALHARWTWDQIGAALKISGTGARRYYERNRRAVTVVGT